MDARAYASPASREPRGASPNRSKHHSRRRRQCSGRARANTCPARVALRGFSALQTERRVSAPAASEPRGALDRGMWIALRCDWRWLRRRPGHLDWRHADAHNDPISVTLVGDPASTGICSSPPFNLSDRLLTSHELMIRPRAPPARCESKLWLARSGERAGGRANGAADCRVSIIGALCASGDMRRSANSLSTVSEMRVTLCGRRVAPSGKQPRRRTHRRDCLRPSEAEGRSAARSVACQVDDADAI